MTMVLKRITAFALAAVTAGALGLNAAAEVTETTPESAALKVYCPTNDDPEFPFNFDIDVDQSSISYIDLDKPVYGFERVLDSEVLDFDVIFSLKDEYKEIGSYTFKVFNSDYSEELFNEQKGNDETVCLSGLSIGNGYKISAVLESDFLNVYYGGYFAVQSELNCSLSVDVFYQQAGMDGEAAPYANIPSENDSPNNNINTPDSINNTGRTATTQFGDEDHFLYTVPRVDKNDKTAERGVAQMDISIQVKDRNIPNLTVKVSYKNGDTIQTYNTANAGSNTTIFITIPNIPLNSSCIIKVTGSTVFPAEYIIKPTVTFKQAWFGQYYSKDKDDGVEYWNTDKLDTIYNTVGSKSYPIFKEMENKPTNYNDDVFATGCGVASSAMIFRNLGKTMNGYDVRTDFTGVLRADPFTALLSNCLSDGTELQNGATQFNYGSAAESMRWDDIGKKFGLTYVPIQNITEATLRSAAVQHGYVLVYFNGGVWGKQHFMVLTDLKPASGSIAFAARAKVCDPAAESYCTGVTTLSNTISNHHNDDLSDITAAGYFI